jgi:hypothetical protein
MIHLGGALSKPPGDLGDDGEELLVLFRLRLAQLFRVQIDLGKQPSEGALEGLILNILEARIQSLQGAVT